MATIEEILQEQDVALEELTQAQQRELQTELNGLRLELRDRMRDEMSDDYSRAKNQAVLLAIVGQLAVKVKASITKALKRAVLLAEKRTVDDLVEVITIEDDLSRKEEAALRREVKAHLREERPASGFALVAASLALAITNAIQLRASPMLLAGDSLKDIIKKVTGARTGVFKSFSGRANLTIRMETNRAYNAVQLSALTAAAAYLDSPKTKDPLMKQAVEFWDARNHPFSRALHGRVAAIDEPFIVPASKVREAAQLLRRSASGILWEKRGPNYVGHNFPAHYGERGRIVPFRNSWSD